MVKGAILRQGRQLLFVALTVALGISLATAMLNVMFDVGEKVNQESLWRKYHGDVKKFLHSERYLRAGR